MAEKPIKKKLVIVGNAGTGKSCLGLAWSRESFSPDYFPTVIEMYSKDVEVDEKVRVDLVCYDTAGPAQYDRLRSMAYPLTDVVAICFGIESRSSLGAVSRKWWPEVQRNSPSAPIVLIANKIDLRSDVEYLKTRLEPLISRDEGEIVATQISAVKYFESSAKTMQNIPIVFETIGRIALGQSQP